jgi:hypothetical protein
LERANSGKGPGSQKRQDGIALAVEGAKAGFEGRPSRVCLRS